MRFHYGNGMLMLLCYIC